MVVFQCELCYAILKKQQVDKHCTGKCRDAWAFTCIECSKTFEGFDYKDHNCAMTEVEKYQGQFLAKRRVEKEKAKQEKAEKQMAEKQTKEKNGKVDESKSSDDEGNEEEKVGAKRKSSEREPDEEGERRRKEFPGWRKAAGQIIEKHGKSKQKHHDGAPYLKKKVMLKKIWKMYSKSK